MTFAVGNKIAKGRPKGAPNKVTGDIRDMIRGALESAGGQSYLLQQAQCNPQAFLTLIGKIIPAEVNASITGGINVTIKQFSPLDKP